MRKIFNWATFTGTLALFAFLFLLQKAAISLDFLNVFEETINDFKLSDLYFGKIRDNDRIPADTNIVIVNIGKYGRADIAAQIDIINKCQPKVVALDILFFRERDPLIDSIFTATIAQTPNLILATKLDKIDKNEETQQITADTLFLPIKAFREQAEKIAFVNLPVDDDKQTFATCRQFIPKIEVLKNPQDPKSTERVSYYAYAIEAARLFDKEKTEAFLKRNNEVEEIYYRGDWQKFTCLNPEDVLEERFEPSLLKGKIVLLGDMGLDYTVEIDGEDRFYTPLNDRPVGRTYTDMYGVVIHANIISMILNSTTLDPMPAWESWLFSILLAFFNVALFTNIYFSRRFGIWYDVLTKVIQFLEIVVFVYIFMILLDKNSVILDITVGILATVLCGDVLEVYLGLITNLWKKITEPYN
ncbi:CHASE2 domain-containing protein [Hugenholtzia roseola]|uniref:CHASE2 domain-containing protein n=1 Tax=Hugenholtzia roseola TaxID=1002 RepID=UPI00042371F9|nr:CHASE2 domain-containing protein [Hugenholtzia roseola]